MRYLLTVAVLVGLATTGFAQDSSKRAADALLEIHEVGRGLYNDGDYTAGYRVYQGGLMVARRMLADRSDVQKLIADGMAAAERLPTVDRRAFRLHELIETVRAELNKTGKSAEHLSVPPREVGSTGKLATKPDPKPAATVKDVKDGVVGRVMWQGAPLAGVEVTFVSLGRPVPRVFEATTSAQGVYAVPTLPAGKYVVLIVPGPNASVKKLPERYATSTTSPLVIDVKAGGEKLDFVLQ